jgi:hypothetical protein
MGKATIQGKLVAVVLGVVFVFLGLSAFMLIKLNTATAELGDLYNKDFRQSVLVNQIDGLSTRIDINILRMLAIGTPETIAEWRRVNTERFVKAEGVLKQMTNEADPTQAPMVKKLRESFNRMRAGMEHQVDRIVAGQMKEASEVNRLEVKDNADTVYTTLEELAKAQQLSAVTRFEAQQTSANLTRNVTIIAIFVVGLFSVFGAIMLGRTILQPIKVAAAVADKFAEGNLGR